jgi:hypothetical protein
MRSARAMGAGSLELASQVEILVGQDRRRLDLSESGVRRDRPGPPLRETRIGVAVRDQHRPAIQEVLQRGGGSVLGEAQPAAGHRHEVVDERIPGLVLVEGEVAGHGCGLGDVAAFDEGCDEQRRG